MAWVALWKWQGTDKKHTGGLRNGFPGCDDPWLQLVGDPALEPHSQTIPNPWPSETVWENKHLLSCSGFETNLLYEEQLINTTF